MPLRKHRASRSRRSPSAPHSLYSLSCARAWRNDLLPDSFEALSDLFVERGEMWLYSEDIAGSHLN
ncbi:MAG: hypothetical protein ACREYC_20290, partial [Gammaproteobacteria bacterium]